MADGVVLPLHQGIWVDQVMSARSQDHVWIWDRNPFHPVRSVVDRPLASIAAGRMRSSSARASQGEFGWFVASEFSIGIGDPAAGRSLPMMASIVAASAQTADRTPKRVQDACFEILCAARPQGTVTVEHRVVS
jgi:hypothetical protein